MVPNANCTIMDPKGFFTQSTDCVFHIPFGWAAAVVALAGYLLLMVIIETVCLMVCCYCVCTKESRRSSTTERKTSHKVEEIEIKDELQEEQPKESTTSVSTNNPTHIYAVLEQPSEQAVSSWQNNDYAVAKDNLEDIPESQHCIPKPALLTRHSRPAHTCYIDYGNVSPIRSNSALPHLHSYKSLEPSHDYVNCETSRHNTVQLSRHSPDHHMTRSPVLRHDPATPSFNFKDRRSLQSSLTRYKKASSPVQLKRDSSAYSNRPLPTPQPVNLDSDDDKDYDHLNIPPDENQSAVSKAHTPAASASDV